MPDNTQRFSNRVNDYVKYRPHYPASVIAYLEEQYHLDKNKKIADIGAGTGISSILFLDAGYHVAAVEPNDAMRMKSIELLGPNKNFEAINGKAEDTQLATHSIDLIVAGQAFHWFDVSPTKKEFKRILKPTGIVALIWNERQTQSPFEKLYEALIRKHGRDYVEVGHRNIGPGNIADFFHPHPYDYKIFPNQQVFDFEGLKGRLLSSSYMPALHEPGYDEMIGELKILFDEYEQNNCITIHYETRVYSGRL